MSRLPQAFIGIAAFIMATAGVISGLWFWGDLFFAWIAGIVDYDPVRESSIGAGNMMLILFLLMAWVMLYLCVQGLLRTLFLGGRTY